MFKTIQSETSKSMSMRLSPAFLFLEAYFALKNGEDEVAKKNIRRVKTICKQYGKNHLDLLNQDIIDGVFKWYANESHDVNPV